MVEIASEPETRAGDIPVYISDCSRLFAHTDWRPTRDPARILGDIHEWIESDRETISRALGS